MGGVCSTHGAKRAAYSVLMGKPEGRRPLRRPRPRREGNIKIDLRDIKWGGVDWTDLAQNRERFKFPMNTVMNLGIP
jgi:hypothetical protein